MEQAVSLDGSDEEEIPEPPPRCGRSSGSGARQPPPSLYFPGVMPKNNLLSWRDGRFSDWKVQVADRSYDLHAFLLARASQFFESHMSIRARAEAESGVPGERGSDLTEVLPKSCHLAFEDTLDFIYSENQLAYEAPAAKALLLLKIADILGIGGLFEAMGRRIEAAFADTAPVLLEQYCRFHIPGTDDGAALRRIREGAVDLIVRKFQSFLTNTEMRTALLRLPAEVLGEILQADHLLVASEDVVMDFVITRLQDQASLASARAADVAESSSAADDEVPPADAAVDADVLWSRVRWVHLSPPNFQNAVALSHSLQRPEMALRALMAHAGKSDFSGNEMAPMVPPRKPILPPGVPPPTSTEIDFCFQYTRSDQYSCGEALRSQPKKIGDIVLRILVFPAGTDTGVARGSLSVFLEAVPQAHWPRDWEFINIRYAIACIKWPAGPGDPCAAKRKSDLWTFKANRLDRGWHDFLAPGEIHRYLGPDGFVCIRGSLEPECLGRVFFLNSQSGQGTSGPGGDAAGSSASRRNWAPRGPGAPANMSE